MANYLCRRLFSSVRSANPAFTRRFSSDALVTTEIKPGEIGVVSGIPEDHLHRKIHLSLGQVNKYYYEPPNKVVIYCPARTATQQGSGKVGRWKINFVSTQKWENPLMGWTSTEDPYANVGDAALTFKSKEASINFAEKHGWQYTVKDPHTPLLRIKSYADNFKWKGPPVCDED